MKTVRKEKRSVAIPAADQIPLGLARHAGALTERTRRLFPPADCLKVADAGVLVGALLKEAEEVHGFPLRTPKSVANSGDSGKPVAAYSVGRNKGKPD